MMNDVDFALMPLAPDGSPKTDGISYCQQPGHETVDGELVFRLLPNGFGRCVDFTLVPYPVADFEADHYEVCTGTPVQFTSLAQYAESWLWDFGDGNTSTEEHPTHTYSIGGYKRVELTVANPAGEDMEGRNGELWVRVQPVAAFSYTTTGNFAHSFADESTGDAESYLWDFGDGSTSTARNPSHVYAGDGTYTVTMTVSNSVCGDSVATQEIVIAAATWHEMTDDTFWAPEADWPWPWDASYCSGGNAWCCYVYTDGAPAVLVPVGTWAAGWRPTKIVLYGCDAPDFFALRDTAGNIIAQGGFGGSGHDIAFQGEDIGRLEFLDSSDGTTIYGCLTEIHFYGPAPT